MNFKSRLHDFSSTLYFAITSPSILKHIYKLKKSKLTYLNLSKLINLSKCVNQIERDQIPGMIVEAGCALGGSAILIALNKKTHRELNIYDTFAQIPPPTEMDEADAFERYQVIKDGKAKGIHDGQYYGYEEDLLTKVINNFETFNLSLDDHNIFLHKGFFEDTLKISEPVAMAHIDSDWYDSIMTSLKRIVPNLSANGIILIDDYYDWKGAEKAVNDFFIDKKDHFQFLYGPQLVIRKSSDIQKS